MAETAIPELVTQVLKERDAARFDACHFSQRPLPDPFNPIVICVLKDEMIRAPDFLRHYREAGIERFAVIDNGSSDGVHEYLSSQPDVDLYLKEGPFHWIPKQGWINRLIAHYGYRRWYIYVDADELIVFDGLGERTFADLTRHAQQSGITRVRGLLVDMYADGPLMESSYVAGDSLAAAYPYFDPEGYVERTFKDILSVKGGPRMRAFGQADAKFRIELTKYPLFTVDRGEHMVNPHYIWPTPGNFLSPRLLGLLHFKFLPDLAARIRNAIALKNYWDESFEYQCYLRAIEADPRLSLWREGSARYRTPMDLISRGLIEAINWPRASSLSLIARRSLNLNRARLQSSGASPQSTQRINAPPIAVEGEKEEGPAEISAAARDQIEIADSEFVGFLP
jgi:hypothetical protein